MKTRLLIFVTVLAAGISVWFYFFRSPTNQEQVESLIPATSLGVLSVQNPREFVNKNARYDWWDELSGLALVSIIEEAVGKIDSLDIQTDLGRLPLHISLHKTGNDQLESLYLIKSVGFEWSQSSIEVIAGRIFGEQGSKITARNYRDRDLYELVAEAGSFSFLIEGNYLALSANALLIEDVVRAVEEGARLLGEVSYSLDAGRSDLSLFLDCNKLEALSSVFFKGEPSVANQSGLFLKVGIEATASGLRLNGTSVLRGDFLTEQESGLNLKNFVPTNASVVKWFGLSETEGKEIDSFDLQAFNELNTGDLCLLDLHLNNQGTDRVLLTALSDIDQGKEKLTDLAESLMVQNDTLFRESFMDTEIIFVNRQELPQQLFGSQFSGFEQTYFSTYNDVLLFGSSIDALKSVLQEYDAENTWGRSIEKRSFIDDLVQEASLTAIYNFEYGLEALKDDLKPTWQDFLDQSPGLVNALDLFSMQLSNTGAGVLVSATIDFNESVTRKAAIADAVLPDANSAIKPLVANVNAFADTTVRTKTFVVRNHNNNQRELMFQDAAQQLYLLTDQGLVQWKKKVSGNIRGNISQIDYYNNRKLQYLFLTDSALYVVDRNGDAVDGFPKLLDTELALEGHRVVDYDNTRRYRYATADRRGNVYLFNKEGEQLEGWNPKRIGAPLLSMPEHVRIRGRDCFIMVDRQGAIHLTNRRGEYYPGFPYKVNKRLGGEVLLVKGADFSKSQMVVTSENGEILTLDFNARVVSRKQLLRPGAQSVFRLIKDKLNNGFVVVRQDRDEAAFFDQSGNEMFKLPVRAAENTEFGFYNFRNDSEVLLVHNLDEQKLSLYNAEGTSVLDRTINATESIGIIYYQSRAEYELFVNFANQMAIYKVAK